MNQLGKILVDPEEYERDRWIATRAEAEWVPLCPKYPDLKGVTCEEIESFIDLYSSDEIESDDMLLLANIDLIREKMLPRHLIEEYLHHVICLDRDEISTQAQLLGAEVAQRYPGVIKEHLTSGQKDLSEHAIFVTTPRGGYAALSIFAYANDLEKYQLPSDIEDEPIEPVDVRLAELREKKATLEESISKAREGMRSANNSIKRDLIRQIISEFENRLKNVENSIATLREPGKIGEGWLGEYSKRITHIFIVDDILASGVQMTMAYRSLRDMFGKDVTIVPVVIAGRRRSKYTKRYPAAIPPIIGLETVGINEFSRTRRGTITVRFPWGSPDGTSDLMLHTLYGSRHEGVSRIRRPTGSEDVTLE